jgi:hypothetical protein
MPYDFPVNGCRNGITLCRYHHVGKGSIHQDTYEALVAYQGGDEEAFEEMMANRKALNEQGIPYWNTQWDWMFNRLVQKNNLAFLRSNPYPANGNRGNTGRLPR